MKMTHSSFSHEIEKDIHPSWKELLASLSEVQATNCPKFDAQALQKDCKEVGHQNDEEKSESIGGTSSHIG